MRVWIPPNDPCIRCDGQISNTVVDNVDKLICTRCGQLWEIGTEGCWEADFEVNKTSRMQREKEWQNFLNRAALQTADTSVKRS